MGPSQGNFKWIRGQHGMFVHELRGAIYLTWVAEKDRSHAAVFPADKLDDWLRILAAMAGVELQAVEPY